MLKLIVLICLLITASRAYAESDDFDGFIQKQMQLDDRDRAEERAFMQEQEMNSKMAEQQRQIDEQRRLIEQIQAQQTNDTRE